MREMKDSGVPWIGAIPKGWSTDKLKYHVRQRTDKSDTKEGYIALDNIESWSGRYLPTGFVPEGDTLLVRTGDILFGKLRPYLAKVYIAVDNACCSSEFVVLNSLDVNRSFLRYLLVNHMFIDEINMSTYGTKMPRANPSFILNSIIPIPSVTEQLRIANFLDAKCDEIDSILEKTRASIEEYKKLKQSVITEAVTKGVCGKRPMKDSGVEWIGEIPQEWKLNRLKSVLSLLTDGTHQTPNYIDEGVPFLSIKDISSGKIDFSDVKFISEAEHLQLSKHANVVKGDVLFTRIGTLGVFVKVDTERVFDIFVSLGLMKIRREMVNTDYLVYYLSSNCVLNYINQVKAGGGTSAAKFNLGDVAKTWIVLPKENEQQEIAAYLDEKCAAIDNLIASKEALITELEAYKKSMIYEYVTGKKEVPEAKSV